MMPEHPLNDVVWCRLAASRIHGVGVVAIRDIPAGTPLFGGEETYDRLHEEAILTEIWGLMQDHYIFLDEFDVLPNPNMDVKLQCFMNHSSTPNSDGKVALRHIQKGEEVTENYTAFGAELSAEAINHYGFLNV